MPEPGPTWALIAGGGTAGHTLPGIAIGRALVARGHSEAAIQFVEAGERDAIITSLDHAAEALAGSAGTPIVA